MGWEIAENSNAVIAAYRESTLALNYHGDSIANSFSDVVAFAAGYTRALRLPAPGSPPPASSSSTWRCC